MKFRWGVVLMKQIYRDSTSETRHELSREVFVIVSFCSPLRILNNLEAQRNGIIFGENFKTLLNGGAKTIPTSTEPSENGSIVAGIIFFLIMSWKLV